MCVARSGLQTFISLYNPVSYKDKYIFMFPWLGLGKDEIFQSQRSTLIFGFVRDMNSDTSKKLKKINLCLQLQLSGRSPVALILGLGLLISRKATYDPMRADENTQQAHDTL